MTVDLYSLGPPCQPFSDARGDRHTSNPRDHDLFPVVFGAVGSAMSSIDEVKPLRLMLEEVGGFGKAFAKNDPETGLERAEHRIMHMVRDDGTQHFCAYAVASVDLASWVDQARFRYRQLAGESTRLSRLPLNAIMLFND
jgi:hypothetical protein